ncbi:PP2C family serine/threonine-protein phosphatase [Luteolibacter sp. SL250]|uniref:PP2C family protein-serine/threonine phosphatase n=1 Tax=Luteolibacter sp. SL250 TaxID=2995170 RepID=UPI002D1E4B5B|nr:PP2C family serine/threonine-protein phosphatase [Luteolibacter sp. SL250]
MSEGALFHWSYRSHSGSRKPRNDDSVVAFASGLGGAESLPESGSRTLSECDLVFAVSDGMGGGNAGDLASSLLLRGMSEMIPETFKAAASGFFPDSLEHLGDTLRAVHEQINVAAASCEEQKGMSATVALAWFTPENLYLANVGDSRIYLSRGGELTQLSKDHTLAWDQWKRGQIGEMQYRSHPRRSALYEVIGGGHPRMRPHLAAVPYLPGDRFLICSDGLIDGLTEQHIANALSEDLSPTGALEKMMERALRSAGGDDTTLIVIHL